MPKLPQASGSEAIRALERLGFAQIRQSGSHVFMRREHSTCVVPAHAKLKVGTLAGVLRQAGITAEEFTAAL
jgi:predicted RNA binding protein YcfA (HicA-like mRNA interferase family)